jgi:hypothetical protein
MRPSAKSTAAKTPAANAVGVLPRGSAQSRITIGGSPALS